ncbi:MAG: hypothetical protein K0R14_1262 [Burkholderiales bacterium]|jgi:hypothetical protein|nr:hypothetical protein [Burkholderiales bacterium]
MIYKLNSLNIFVAKLFFITSICFASTMCFAGQTEELERLGYINAALVNHFDPKQSRSRISHEVIIRNMADRKLQFSSEQTLKLLPVLLRVPLANNKLEEYVNEDFALGYVLALEGGDKRPHDILVKNHFVNPLMSMWQKPVEKRNISCFQYTLYSFFAVVFDIMNQRVREEKPLFTYVGILNTNYLTGDHRAVLVEGDSKTVYILDPWYGKVIQVPSAEDKNGLLNLLLSKKTTNPSLKKGLPLDEMDAIINELFKDKGFYDMIYVSPTTKWSLFYSLSLHLRNIIETKNPDIKLLYDELQPAFQWATAYDELPFPDKTAEKKEERK